jgi:S1-C subfamily serine protease
MKNLLVLVVLLFSAVIESCQTTTLSKSVKKLTPQELFGSVQSLPSEDPIVQACQKRAVTITSADKVCSGGITSSGVIVTASHCYPAGRDQRVHVNGLKAKVVKNLAGTDAYDLMILSGATGEFNLLEFAEPEIGAEVFIVTSQEEYRAVVKRGRIINVQDDMFSTDISVIDGGSGGFVYTREGRLVGMVTQRAPKSQCISARKIIDVL